MPTTSLILFPTTAPASAAGSTPWRIACVVDAEVTVTEVLPPTDASSESIAKMVADALRSSGFIGHGLTLAIPSADCLAASIDLAGLSRNDRKAMLYRLEEKLPLAAEAIAADFVSADASAHRSLGVCVRLDRLDPLRRALEAAGVGLQSIVPAAFLAAQQLSQPGTDELLLIGEGNQVSVVRTSAGVPVSWSLVAATEEDLHLTLDLLELDGELPEDVRVLGVDPKLGLGSTPAGMSPVHAAASAAARAAEGRLKLWIELARGPLASPARFRRHFAAIRAIAAAAAIFLLCLLASLLWRAHRFDVVAEEARSTMRADFSKAFPGWVVPDNVATVVASEHRKLNLRQPAALPAEAKESAYTTLQVVLSSLPPAVKVRMDALSFNALTFEMQGRVRTFPEVDVLSAAIRAEGAEVAPAQARRDADGYWNFTITGTRRPVVAKN